jgi:hypothetical protein
MATRRPRAPLRESFGEGCCSGSRRVPRRGAAVLKKARRPEDTLFPKHKQATRGTRGTGVGSVWTWTCIDADTKLIPSWLVCTSDAGTAYAFMSDVASRLRGRAHLTRSGCRLKAYSARTSTTRRPAKSEVRGRWYRAASSLVALQARADLRRLNSTQVELIVESRVWRRAAAAASQRRSRSSVSS